MADAVQAVDAEAVAHGVRRGVEEVEVVDLLRLGVAATGAGVPGVAVDGAAAVGEQHDEAKLIGPGTEVGEGEGAQGVASRAVQHDQARAGALGQLGDVDVGATGQLVDGDRQPVQPGLGEGSAGILQLGQVGRIVAEQAAGGAEGEQQGREGQAHRVLREVGARVPYFVRR